MSLMRDQVTPPPAVSVCFETYKKERAEILDLRRQLPELAKERDEALAKLAQAEKERDEGRAKIADLEDDRATLTASVKCWSDANHELRRICDALRAESLVFRQQIRKPSDMEQFEASDLVARLRREKLAILADYAGVLASVCEDNPNLTQYLDVLEGLSEQMTETIRDLKGGSE